MDPISSEDDLKKAIRAVLRDGEDETRLQIIDAARSLKLGELIPDAWGEGGKVEQRDTANDVSSGLESALTDALGDGDCCCGCDCYYLWVQDWLGGGEEDSPYTVIYQYHGDMFSAPFSFDDAGKITIDVEAAVKVRRITYFIERAKPKQRTAAWGARELRKAKAEMLSSTWERRDWQRSFGVSDLEIRDRDDGLKWVGGYASVFEREYEVGYYTEVVDQRAANRTLSENPDTVFLLNHAGAPLARTITDAIPGGEYKSLQLDAPSKGLRYDAGLQIHDPDVQSLIPKFERKDLSESSFAFLVRDQDWDADFTKRRILDFSLHKGDVSVVNYGANPAATAGLRALRAMGSADTIVDALLELRAGKKLSSANEEALSRVLALVAEADESVDEAQPLLARVLGVENPDDTDGDGEDDGERSLAVVPSYASIARAKRDRSMRAA